MVLKVWLCGSYRKALRTYFRLHGVYVFDEKKIDVLGMRTAIR